MTKNWSLYGDGRLVSAPQKKKWAIGECPDRFSLEKLTILKKKFAQIGPPNQKLQLFESLNNFWYFGKNLFYKYWLFSK